MTTAPEAPELTEVTARRGVGAVDLLWLTWRQHRWTIASGVLLVLATWGYILWNESTMNPRDFARCREQCMFSPSLAFITDQRNTADIHIVLAGALGLIIAVFWAAPLIAREYEQRTNLLAWSQDVSQRRWLVGKIVPLAILATGLAAVLGALVVGEVNRMYGLGGIDYYRQFTLLHFEASVPLQASFALFGFALGVAVSSVVRRVVPAMGVTVLLFVAIRAGFTQLRDRYLPPVHVFTPLASPGTPVPYRSDMMLLDGGQVDASGHLVTTLNCTGPITTDQEFLACERQSHIAGSFVDYQPAARLATFRLIEAGIFVVLAVAAFTVVWIRTRRTATTG